MKVLIVDDNRTNRRILQGMLERLGMNTFAAENGAEAIRQLRAGREAGEPYALILTDMDMPDMDGLSLVETIQHTPDCSTATIMMLTSVSHRGDAARCKELGIAAYLLKPVRQSELREAIARVLDTQLQEAVVPLETPSQLQDIPKQTGGLRILVAEDNPVNQRVAARLLEKKGHRVIVVSTGQRSTFGNRRRAVGSGPDGHSNAGVGRTGNHRGHPTKGEDHRRTSARIRSDRPRHEGRSGAMPGGGDGRIYQQADSC